MKFIASGLCVCSLFNLFPHVRAAQDENLVCVSEVKDQSEKDADTADKIIGLGAEKQENITGEEVKSELKDDDHDKNAKWIEINLKDILVVAGKGTLAFFMLAVLPFLSGLLKSGELKSYFGVVETVLQYYWCYSALGYVTKKLGIE